MAVKTNYEKNGIKYYRTSATVGFAPDGKRIRKDFFGKNKKEAEQKRDEYLEQLSKGIVIDKNTALLGDLMYDWLYNVIYYTNRSATTFDRYEGIYRNYIKKEEINVWKLGEAKTHRIQKYYNCLCENGKSASVITNLNKLLKMFFNYCVANDFIIKNPCLGLIIPDAKSITNNKKTVTSDVEPFSDAEINEIKKHLPEGRNIGILFLLCLGTGLRQGEALAMTKRDIDFGSSSLTVTKSLKRIKHIKKDGSYDYEFVTQPPKTKNSARTIHVPSALLKILRKHISAQNNKFNNNGLIFTDNSLLFTTESCLPIDARNLVRAWERLLKKAGVRYRKFHNIRHTYATKLFELEVPLKTVSALLGHSSITITADTYTHVMPKQKSDATDKLNIYFG